MEPFKKKELKPKNIFKQFFNLVVKENFNIELNNYLSIMDAKNLESSKIEELFYKYKLSLNIIIQDQFNGFYRQLLTHYLTDNKLSEDEILNLKYIKSFFNLSDRTVVSIENDLVSKIYKKEVKKAFSDDNLSQEEKIFLQNLKKDLRISDDLSQKIFNESAKQLFNKVVNNVIADERVSPDELEQLNQLALNLNIPINIDNPTKILFDKYKLFWEIENGELPDLDSGINLQKDEICYYMSPCEWFELRRQTHSVNYGGVNIRVKVMKGVNLNFGKVKLKPIVTDELTLIDTGLLYITNKRLIFIGNKSNKNFKLNKILDFSIFSNGIEIDKDSGKSPFLKISNNSDLLAMILRRAILEF